ncbi:MAG: dockerin type I domain-containing protein [Clostridia bacterium]|nr:dockerin type I domain-containing protein [Clostridia bacterium]
MKRIISIILAVMLALPSTIAANASIANDEDFMTCVQTTKTMNDNVDYFSTDTDISFRSTSNGSDPSISVHYDDRYFMADSSVYSNDLAKLSLRMSLSAFNCAADDGSYENKSRNIVDFMNKCKFENIYVNEDFKKKPTQDSIGVCLATRKIGDTTLIAVAIRGGGYESEWAGNFNAVTTGDTHPGYEIAARSVQKCINSYINRDYTLLQEHEDGKTKLWMVGYSRGGAVANLASARILDEMMFPKERMYTYTFEAPQPSAAAYHGDEYGCIFNIVNPVDLVPKLIMKDWGYGRYGKDYYIHTKNNVTFDKVSDEVLKRANRYLELGGEEWFEEIPGSTTANAPALDDVVTMVADELGSPNSSKSILLVGILKVVFLRKYGSLRGEPDIDISEELLDTLGRVINVKFDINYIQQGIKAHYPELTLAWLDTVPPLPSPDDYRKVSLNSKVNISVYDSKSNLVSQTKGGKPQSIEGSGIEAVIKDDSQILYLPTFEEYIIRLTTVNDDDLNYKVTEFIDGEAGKTVRYDGIKVISGEKYTGIIENLEKTKDAKYMLFKGDSHIPVYNDTDIEPEDDTDSFIIIETDSDITTDTTSDTLTDSTDTSSDTEQKHIIPGDLNEDDIVTMEDVVLLQRHIADLVAIPNKTLLCADVNFDKDVNMEDVTRMQTYIAKLIDSF